MSRAWLRSGAIVVVAGLLGCQPVQPSYQVERTRSYQQSKAEVWDQILQFLQASDITVVRSGPGRGVIEAARTNYQDAGWADCRLARVTDRSSNNARPRRARQRVDRNLALTIDVRDAAGATEVTLDARFSERQINPFRNLPFRTGCVSKGVLESSLLNAL